MKAWHKATISVIAIIIVLLLIAPPIGKRYFENNSEKIIGRKVDIGKLHINFLNLAINIKDFKLYETDKTSSFLSFDQLYINYDLPPLITRTYAVSELKLVGPKINIIQDSLGFNFNDLISSDSTKVKKQKDQKKELRFSVKDIQLVDGEIVYKGDKIDNPIDLNNLNLNIPIVAWDNIALFGRGTPQHRHGRGGLHRAAGEDGGRDGRLHRQNRLRPLQARRHAAQADGLLQDPRRGVASQDRPARRARKDLRLVPGAEGERSPWVVN